MLSSCNLQIISFCKGAGKPFSKYFKEFPGKQNANMGGKLSFNVSLKFSIGINFAQSKELPFGRCISQRESKEVFH